MAEGDNPMIGLFMAAATGPGGQALFFSQAESDSIIAAMKATEADIWGMCYRAWFPLCSLMIMYAVLAWWLSGRPFWHGFILPIISLALLQGYDPVAKTLMDVPQALGEKLRDSTYEELVGVVNQATVKVNAYGNVSGAGGSKGRGVVGKVVTGIVAEMVLSISAAAVAVGTITWLLLQILQTTVYGVLYVLGPIFCLAACTGGRSPGLRDGS